ncbi:hypothetical protein [Leptospira interrogans]|uniref:hypothetical protein n=1 Tax=Leptospira interrogans TaxID=173 RepID=UPI0015E3E31C
MKLRILNILILSLFSCISLTCQIGTRTDACKSDLRRATVFEPSNDSCEILGIGQLLPESREDTPNQNGINLLLFNCYQYYTKLKECEKEGNRYTPALYSRE